MEADISIWRKPGHFYFALTWMVGLLSGLPEACWSWCTLSPVFLRNVITIKRLS
jgi:hypothetical protein